MKELGGNQAPYLKHKCSRKHSTKRKSFGSSAPAGLTWSLRYRDILSHPLQLPFPALGKLVTNEVAAFAADTNYY